MALPSLDVMRTVVGFVRPSMQKDMFENPQTVDVFGLSDPPDVVKIRTALDELFRLHHHAMPDEINDIHRFFGGIYPLINWTWYRGQKNPTILPQHLHPFMHMLTLASATEKIEFIGPYNIPVSEEVGDIVRELSQYDGFQYAADLCLLSEIFHVIMLMPGHADEYLMAGVNSEMLPDAIKKLGQSCDTICQFGANPAAFDHMAIFLLCDLIDQDPETIQILNACMSSKAIRDAVAKDPQVSRMVARKQEAYLETRNGRDMCSFM